MGKLIGIHYYLHNEPEKVDVFEVSNEEGHDTFTLVGVFIKRGNEMTGTSPFDYEHYDEIRRNAIDIFKGNIVVEV